MSNEFTITVASNSLALDPQRQGSVTYTAFNASGRSLSGRANLKTVPENQPHNTWLQIDGPAERPFAIGAAEQFTVRVQVPPVAAAGNYTIRLNMVDVADTDEGVSEGPTVTIAVPAPIPPKKKRPLGLLALLAALLLIVIAAAVFFFLRPRTITVPPVTGLTEAQAEGTLVATGLQIGRVREESSASVAVGLVARTEPEQNAPIGKATPVSLFISSGGNVTPTATPDLPATVQAMTLETAVAGTATAGALATETAMVAAAAVTADALLQAAIGKYTGTWIEQNESDANEISKLEISNSGMDVTIRATGDVKSFPGSSGGLAEQVCVPPLGPGVCILGQNTQPYPGDPMNFEISADTGLLHKLTLTYVQSSTKLSVVDDIYTGNTLLSTQNYLLKPEVSRPFKQETFLDLEQVEGVMQLLITTPTP